MSTKAQPRSGTFQQHLCREGVGEGGKGNLCVFISLSGPRQPGRRGLLSQHNVLGGRQPGKRWSRHTDSRCRSRRPPWRRITAETGPLILLQPGSNRPQPCAHLAGAWGCASQPEHAAWLGSPPPPPRLALPGGPLPSPARLPSQGAPSGHIPGTARPAQLPGRPRVFRRGVRHSSVVLPPAHPNQRQDKVT